MAIFRKEGRPKSKIDGESSGPQLESLATIRLGAIGVIREQASCPPLGQSVRNRGPMSEKIGHVAFLIRGDVKRGQIGMPLR
jgi:hypothetical protein